MAGAAPAASNPNPNPNSNPNPNPSQVCCSLLNAFKLVMDASFLAPYKAVVRWFTTCAAPPELLSTSSLVPPP